VLHLDRAMVWGRENQNKRLDKLGKRDTAIDTLLCFIYS
jgi:hypothetical protein